MLPYCTPRCIHITALPSLLMGCPLPTRPWGALEGIVLMFHATLAAYAEYLRENEVLRELKSVRKIDV